MRCNSQAFGLLRCYNRGIMMPNYALRSILLTTAMLSAGCINVQGTTESTSGSEASSDTMSTGGTMGTGDTTNTGGCDEGSLGCSCYGNDTCNDGLVCSGGDICIPEDCEAGTEGCICYGNNTCNDGLECGGKGICEPSQGNTTGDTTGDTGTSTGDTGDTTGDTTGPALCMPDMMMADPCQLCVGPACCDQLLACTEDVGCACFVACLGINGDAPKCADQCNVNPQAGVTGELILCMVQACSTECNLG